LLHVRQGDVDDGGVEHDHELRRRDHDERETEVTRHVRRGRRFCFWGYR
jgi:hypothetical protein